MHAMQMVLHAACLLSMHTCAAQPQHQYERMQWVTNCKTVLNADPAEQQKH
jgi:hypothetical protein